MRKHAERRSWSGPHVPRLRFPEMSATGKSVETENRFVVARGCGTQRWGVATRGYGVSFYGDGNAPDSGVGCTRE